MRYFIFLLLPCFALAQGRNNKPLPVLAEDAAGILEDNITGWCYSLDGQWINSENIIPARGVSRDKEFYKRDENSLGLDNLKVLKTYPIKYGDKTLLLLVKIFEKGYYKYPATKSKWKVQTNAYYYVVPFETLSQLSSLQNGEETKIIIEMIHGGLIEDIKESEVLSEIENQLIIKENYDRNMVLQLRPYQEKNIMQFQLFSLHEIFSDVEGVLKDFTLNGKSVYGSPVLLEYMYFETSLDNFKSLFSLNTNVEYRSK